MWACFRETKTEKNMCKFKICGLLTLYEKCKGIDAYKMRNYLLQHFGLICEGKFSEKYIDA